MIVVLHPVTKYSLSYRKANFAASVTPFQLSVRKGGAGKPSLLKRLAAPASSAQP
jgi:hypothetical protein